MNNFLILFFILGLSIGCSQPAPPRLIGQCEGCELLFEGMPADLSWWVNLTNGTAPGEPLHLSGTILQSDGKTPAAGVILYVYQTDSKGLYSKGANQKHGLRHGNLRGWMKTDARGFYDLTTIRPASYPNSENPQHIHPIIFEPGKGYYWIDEFQFDDDPLLTTRERSRLQNRGGSGVTTLTRNAQGVWEGKRTITLGLNVAGY